MISLLLAAGGCCTLGLGSLLAIPAAIVALWLERKDPGAYTGGNFARIALVIGVMTVGSLAFFFAGGGYFGPNGPRWGHSMRAINESGAIGEVRVLLDAERRYAEASGGAYATLACLEDAKRCLPDYPADQPARLVDWRADRGTFRFFFHEGPRTEDRGGATAAGLAGFAVVAAPRDGNAGRRAFCADATGHVRWMPSTGEAPSVVGGRCPESMAVLQ